MKISVLGSKEIKAARELVSKVQDYIEVKGHEVVEEGLRGADVVITLGGDGTLIHLACEHVEANVPFFGVNVGTLGFLTAVEAGEWKKLVDSIIEGNYFVSERMMLEAKILVRGKDIYRAVNEIVVKGMYRVVDLEIVVNGQKFLEISGDGVIVSTQTGSTAYSLSAGGPIVDPDVDCFLITPVNAHGLPIPSVALSPEDVVEVKINDGDDVSLIVDGQEHTKVEKGQSVKVQKGNFRVKLGYLDKNHFLKALNAKFGLAGRLSK